MMKPTSYGSQNAEEEGRAFVRREIVPPPSRGARSRASARKRVIAGASAVLVGAAVAATCGYVALSGSSVSTNEDTTATTVAEPLSLQAATLLESLAAQAGLDDATFDSLDVDGDGFVTKEEYVGRLQKRRDDVLAKLTQSNLADDVKQPVAAIIRDNFDSEAACFSRVFDSSGNKAVDRDAFAFVHPLVVSFCKKSELEALTSDVIPANPDQQQGGGGGETIDGDIPAPASPGDSSETIDGDVPTPTSPADGGETIDGDVPSPTEPAEDGGLDIDGDVPAPTSPGDVGETIDGDLPSPTEPPEDGGGETIDGDVPLPVTDSPTDNVDDDIDVVDTPDETSQAPTPGAPGDTDDGDVTEPPSSPGDDDVLPTDPTSPDTESPPIGDTEVPIDDSLPGEQISPQPGLPGTPPATYDDSTTDGSGLGDTTSEPSDSPTAPPSDDDDGPTGDDVTPTTDAPGTDDTVDTPSSDAAGPSDEVPTDGNDSTSAPNGPTDNGDDTPATDEPDAPPSDGTTPFSDTPSSDTPSSDTPAFDEPDSPQSDGSNTSSDDAPTTNAPDVPASATPEPWDPSTPSDPNVDAADITPGPVVWDPSQPSMPPSDDVTAVPSSDEPSPSEDTPVAVDTESPATTSPPGSLTSVIDNALKDLTLPNDGTNSTAGGANDDPAVIQKFLDELKPNSTANGSGNPETKSAERLAFEDALKKQLTHELKDHAQRLAYANLQIKKNAFMLELIEECVTHAGRRFELDPSFTNEQAIAWIKTDCLVFPHNVMQEPSN